MGATETATVLFTDLVASTELRSALGEDAADDLRRAHDELLAEAVALHDGRLVKGLGDGCMATFASASDGLSAAVAIQQSLHRFNAGTGRPPLSVRVGLSTGDVVWEDGDCFGVPVIEAARLCSAAAGGQVLAADVLRLLVRSRGSHRFEPVGDLELKGLPDPVPAAVVLWDPLPDPGAHGLPVPDLLEADGRLGLAGRGPERAALLTAWATAVTGTRQAVLLAGEPGIGKTRLAAEVAREAHAQGALVLYGRCEEDLGAPYQPFVEALDHFVTRLPPVALMERLGRHAGELSRLCPEVATRVPQLDPPLRADAETERYRLFEAVASWLCAASVPAGLVLVLDDLHWATRPTLVLLQHVLHATGSAPLLVVGTYRDTDLDRAHPLAGLLADLRRSPGVSRLPLSGLDRDGVLELVADAAGHDLDRPGVELAEALHGETEGNPFFVRETLRHLRETGAIFERDGRWVSHLPAQQVGIPEGIREVVGRRLDRLSPEANTALSTAAVVGRDFDLATVSSASGLAEDVTVEALDEAVRARLAEETGVGAYRFSHALVRSTLYDELRATRRARTHAAVGRALEQTRPGDTAALAHHFVQAGPTGDLEKAVRYATAAGDEAMQQLAHDRAVDHYHQALELLDAEDGRSRRRAELLVALGHAQERSGDAAHRATLLTAARMAEGLGEVDVLVTAALANTRGFWSMAGEVDAERLEVLEHAVSRIGPDDSADRARLLAVMSTELMFTSEDERRHALSDEAVAVARRLDDPAALADVLLWSVPANFVPWRMEVLLRSSVELVELAGTLDDPQRWASANLWDFIAHAAAGDLETADRRLAVARDAAADLGQPTLRWLVSSWTTYRTLADGDLDTAEAQMSATLDLGQRTGQPDAFTWYAGQLWLLMWERGGMVGLRGAVEDEVERNPGLPAWRTVLGMIHCIDGRLDDARAVLTHLAPHGRLAVAKDLLWLCTVGSSLEISERVGDLERGRSLYDDLLPFRHLPVHAGVVYLGSAERYLACTARAEGRLDDAVEHLEAAVAFEERLAARTWLGVACADLARTLSLRGAPGDAARAADLAARARALAAETGSVRVERRLAGLLG